MQRKNAAAQHAGLWLWLWLWLWLRLNFRPACLPMNSRK